MKSSGLFRLVVLLALGTLAPWAVEDSPSGVKAGVCPIRVPAPCFKQEKPECPSDWTCPGLKKCCSYPYGIKCQHPHKISNSVKEKPGKCPMVDGHCLMLNPYNFCENDGQCQDKFKCCVGVCGKICSYPAKV
ncbi:PREDICTED: antileukoproteinase [Propithecus coquereli]|uniref:Secretory leukocyte peptidase inhibitor n=1 Tax=Propithecus coquereli TaxID=379532 RepID=A0A2K6FUR5_PROCO|nr:PREDICTED: antileukoproteinase [Propithecus coquereli]